MPGVILALGRREAAVGEFTRKIHDRHVLQDTGILDSHLDKLNKRPQRSLVLGVLGSGKWVNAGPQFGCGGNFASGVSSTLLLFMFCEEAFAPTRHRI